MVENNKKKVFISYCGANDELAQYFCRLLEGNDIACWIAPRDIPSSEDWAENIVKGLNECDVVAFLVSKASVDSNEVAKEINLANSFKKEVFQVRLEEATLSSAMMYHLSNKQWVNAIDGVKSVRFNAALEAIRKKLKIEGGQVSVSDHSVIGQARKLVEQMRVNHGEALDKLNTLISLQEIGSDSVRIVFPIRFGATGLDLLFDFNGRADACSIEFYANAVFSGDRLKDNFWVHFLAKEGSPVQPLFPGKERSSRSRWKCFHLLKHTLIPSDITCLITPVETFSIYKAQMLALSTKFFPSVLDWALYVNSVCKAVVSLQDKLRSEFSDGNEKSAWIVGAPEGSGLADCRAGGQINIFRKSWQPLTDNYRGRGLLSITIESSGHFLSDLKIGIRKYEKWHVFGEKENNRLADSLTSTCRKLLGESVSSNAEWVCCLPLEAPWNNSGIGSAEFLWQDKLDKFESYCLEKFKALKTMDADLDAACRELPALQDVNPFELPEEQQKNWWVDHLYVRNRQRLIAENLKKQIDDDIIQVEYRYRGEGNWNHIFLKFAVGSFEIAIAFKFYQIKIEVEILSLEQPDFETPIARQFIERCFKETIVLIDQKINATQNFDGRSISEWLDMVQTFVDERAVTCICALKALRSHLENVVTLTDSVNSTLVEVLSEWKIDNRASLLAPGNSINIWHSDWRKNGAKDSDLPPLMLQIVPTKPCFEGLVISLNQIEHIAPQFEHSLGMVCGAFEFAFVKDIKATKERYGIWSTTLPKHSITGGSNFDTPLLSGDELLSFECYLKEVAENIKRVEPLILSLCNEHNEQVHFIGGMNNLIDGLSKSIEEVFPKNDGWNITSNAKSLERWAKIQVFKETWKKGGHTPGFLTIAIEAGQANFDDLCYGIIDSGLLTIEEKEILRKQMNDHKNLGYGRKSDTWPWFKYAESDARLTGGRDKKVIDENTQDVLRRFFKDKLSIIKTDIVPTIENILVSDTK